MQVNQGCTLVHTGDSFSRQNIKKYQWKAEVKIKLIAFLNFVAIHIKLNEVYETTTYTHKNNFSKSFATWITIYTI